MRGWLSRVVLFTAVCLALLNARCFAVCSLDSVQAEAAEESHCHQPDAPQKPVQPQCTHYFVQSDEAQVQQSSPALDLYPVPTPVHEVSLIPSSRLLTSVSNSSPPSSPPLLFSLRI